jgi:hypothetical protein
MPCVAALSAAGGNLGRINPRCSQPRNKRGRGRIVLSSTSRESCCFG